MPDAGAGGKVEGFRLRRLEKPEEFRQVEEVYRAAFGAEGSGPVPPPLQRALQDNGGLVLGAFADIYLAGCAVSLIGWDGTTLYHYSHVTAVRPEYQNHHLGFRLKAYQREEVLKLGLPEIRWTFDPLLSRNALLSVRRLGSRPDRYLPHYYGQVDDAANRGLETDRLRTVWTLGGPGVEERLAGRPVNAAADLERFRRSFAIVETEPGESGLRVPTAVSEPSGDSAHLEIPFDFAAVREHQPATTRPWRHAVRDAFRAAFDLGYVVDDFAVVAPEHERRSVYFLSKSAPPPAAGAPPER